MANSAKITCPNCGTDIDVSDALKHQIEGQLRSGYEKKNEELDASYKVKIEELKKEKDEAEKKTAELKDKEYQEKLKKERQKIQEEIIQEKSDELKALSEALKEKSEQVKELNRTKAEVEKLKLEKDELTDKIIAEKEKEFNEKLKSEREANKQSFNLEREKLRKEIDDENKLKFDEMNKQMDDQKKLIDEMKRKAEQGSMQTQGEVQELAIEEILRSTFPFDKIDEVGKGVKGADVIQTVRNKIGENVGVIVYESKRTKAFSNDWIGKLKSDGALVKADICILITQVLPSDIDRMGQKDGVWICSFEDFKGLAMVIRESLIRVSEAYSSQTNKGEKMQMLYDYLTGNEFRTQFGTIIEGFSDLQKSYLDEKKRMEKIWKEREKQLEKVLINASQFIGSIKGIAGSSISDLPEFENEQLLLEN